MVYRTIAMFCLSAALLPPTGPARAGDILTTAPIDYSLYREGEVRRNERQFDGWLLTCDEIRRLGQKFCSMRTVARSPDGTIVAAMTVSTDDGGRPAAIMTLPFGTSLRTGVNFSFGSASARRGATPGLTPRPVKCEDMGCQVVWSLRSDDIRELRSGNAIKLSFRMNTRPAAFPSLSANTMTTVNGTVDAKGFSDALAASLH